MNDSDDPGDLLAIVDVNRQAVLNLFNADNLFASGIRRYRSDLLGPNRGCEVEAD